MFPASRHLHIHGQMMDSKSATPKAQTQSEGNGRPQRELLWRWGIPVAVSVVLALIPAPTGLKENAWHFFALFAGIVAALVLEPIPPAATGVVAITLGALLSRWTLFSPEELANPKFKAASETVKWAFSGFARGLHVRPCVREDRTRQAHRAAAGEAARQEFIVARIRGGPGRYGAGAVHTVEYRAQCRHYVPGIHQSAANL